MIDKVTKLFSGKALCYSKNKNFGKLVLSFLKINTTLSKEQKSLMAEIIAVNETLFKRPMENILRNMWSLYLQIYIDNKKYFLQSFIKAMLFDYTVLSSFNYLNTYK
jgi:hypothetical protein